MAALASAASGHDGRAAATLAAATAVPDMATNCVSGGEWIENSAGTAAAAPAEAA